MKTVKLIFKAQLCDGPVQVVGGYEAYEEDLEGYDSIEEFLQNTGSDWAYDAVHSDCLKYWAEVADEA